MYSIQLHKLSEDMMDYLEARDKSTYTMLYEKLDEIELMGPAHGQCRRIVGSYKTPIYRVRAKRWRILFTEDDHLLRIWIIDIEKDTKKDYERWIQYIRSQS